MIRRGRRVKFSLLPQLVRFDHSLAFSTIFVLFAVVASSASVRRWAPACRLRHMRTSSLTPETPPAAAATAATTASVAMSLVASARRP